MHRKFFDLLNKSKKVAKRVLNFLDHPLFEKGVAKVKPYIKRAENVVVRITLHPKSAKIFFASVIFVFALDVGIMGWEWYRSLPVRQIPVLVKGEETNFIAGQMSASANIIVTLPQGVSREEAKSRITFTPKIRGHFIDETKESNELTARQIAYAPDRPLQLRSTYRVVMDIPGHEKQGEFFVMEDPKVVAVFPAKGIEVNERSALTVVFSRPMVPLTTREVLDASKLPVHLAPNVPGKWRWKSTRVLTFEPKTGDEYRFPRATKFDVKIDGAVNEDYVPMPGLVSDFTTRHLRQESFGDESFQMSIRQPFVVHYDQDIDLGRMKPAITVTRNDANFPVRITYGEKSIWKENREMKVEDHSALRVFPVADKFNRKDRWDFSSNYALTIPKAIPTEGNIGIDSSLVRKSSTQALLTGTSVNSTRTDMSDAGMFDPEGSVEYHFSEVVDKDKSVISGDGIAKIEYGKMCAVNDPNYDGPIDIENCPQVDDHRSIIVSFDPSQLPKASVAHVSVDKLVEMDGTVSEKIEKPLALHVYPALRITKVVTGQKKNDNSVTNLTVCTNAPLRQYKPKEGYDAVKADGYMAMQGISTSRVRDIEKEARACGADEYQTSVRYGLFPTTPYHIVLDLTSAFGDHATRELNFTTGEAPEEYVRFTAMQSSLVTAPVGKSNLLFATENLEYVNVEVCKLSPEGMMQAMRRPGMQPDPKKDPACEGVKKDRIELPHRYWVNNYFHFSPEKYFAGTGHYRITFSHPKLVNEWDDKSPRKDVTLISVTNLLVTEKRVSNDAGCSGCDYGSQHPDLPKAPASVKSLYWVLRAGSLEPVKDASVVPYKNPSAGENGMPDDSKPATKGESVSTTDVSGFAELPPSIPGDPVLVRDGEDTAIVDESGRLAWAQVAHGDSRTYVYTDRPIYRAGDTVHIKVIDRVGYDGAYQITEQKEAPVTVRDSRGNVVYDQKRPVGEFGTITADVELPKDAALGDYYITVFGNGGSFSVEAYRPAAFKFELTSRKDEYIVGDAAKVSVDASYYFGAKVSGKVEYSITAQDYHFDRFSDGRFSFGGDWYDCERCGYGDKFLFRGTKKVEMGTANIDIPLDWAKYFKDPDNEGSKLVTVRATVTDGAGHAISSEKTLIVHRGQFYLGVQPEDYSGPSGKPVRIFMKSVTTQGVPIAKSNLTLTAQTREWKNYRRREVDGSYYWHSDEVRETIWTSPVSTDGDGNASAPFTPPKDRDYVLVLTGTDGLGNKIKAEASYWVWGGESVKPTNNATLELAASNTDAKAGDVVTFTIPDSLPGEAKALVTKERGSIVSREVLELTPGNHVYKLTVTDDDAPNVFVSVVLVGADGSVKYGTQEIRVNADSHALKVNINPNKSEYLPGEKVMLDVSAVDADGNPAIANVSIAAVDLSVLALKGNPKKQPLRYFYDGFPNVVGTRASMKNLLIERDIPSGTKGGDGGNPNDLEKKKRGTFKDTAFWAAEVVTGKNGHAQASFELPDNITTWQAEAVAVTKATQLGVGYKEFLAQKRVFTQPIVPRFIIAGDEFEVGAQVFNRLDSTNSFMVSLSSTTLASEDKNSVNVTIPAGGSKVVWFKVTAPVSIPTGKHTLEFKVVGAGKLDIIEQEIPLTQNFAAEAVQTSGAIVGGGARESVEIPSNVIPDKGGLEFSLSTSLAHLIPGALDYLIHYPYGCNEQVASQVEVLALALSSDKAIPGLVTDGKMFTYNNATYDLQGLLMAGTNKLIEGRNPDGGWGFYVNNTSSVTLTAHVLRALKSAKAAGADVPDDLIKSSEASLYTLLTSSEQVRHNDMLVVDAALAIGEGDGLGVFDRMRLKGRVSRMLGFTTNLAKFDNGTLTKLIQLNKFDAYKNSLGSVFAQLESRVVVDGRGAHLAGLSSPWGEGFDTSLTNTALLVQAETESGRDYPLVHELLRTLASARDPEYGFNGSNQTLAVIEALIAHAKAAKLNGKTLQGSVELGDEKFTKTFTDNDNAPVNSFFEMSKIEKSKTLPLTIRREAGFGVKSPLFYTALLRYFYPIKDLPARDEGILVERSLWSLDAEGKPLAQVKEAKVGEVLMGKLHLTVGAPIHAAALEDYIPAGFSLVNMSLSIEDHSLFAGEPAEGVMTLEGHDEKHDDRNFVFVEDLAPGEYEYTYFIRAGNPGVYQHLPAQMSAMYVPEIFGRSEGGEVTVRE